MRRGVTGEGDTTGAGLRKGGAKGFGRRAKARVDLRTRRGKIRDAACKKSSRSNSVSG